MIGARVRRREDRPLLTGRACFLDDLTPPDTLELAFARSTQGHARLLGVDLDEAARAPGVTLAFGAEQMACPPLVPDLARPGAMRTERPILAADRVRFVGEAFAAVVASSRYLAEDAAERIAARYEPLAAVTCVEDALRDDLPPLRRRRPGNNVIFEETYEYGDVDAGFDAAAVVIERTFHNPRYSATPIEGRGVLADPRRPPASCCGPRLRSRTFSRRRSPTCWTSSGVSVRCPDIGGGFGQKAHVFPEEVAVAWAAFQLAPSGQVGRGPRRELRQRVTFSRAARPRPDRGGLRRPAARGRGRRSTATSAPTASTRGARCSRLSARR